MSKEKESQEHLAYLESLDWKNMKGEDLANLLLQGKPRKRTKEEGLQSSTPKDPNKPSTQ